MRAVRGPTLWVESSGVLRPAPLGRRLSGVLLAWWFAVYTPSGISMVGPFRSPSQCEWVRERAVLYYAGPAGWVVPMCWESR